MSVLGDNLKKARERLGLTRPDFAEKMGCGDNTVWRWEKGEREPDLETLFKLAEKLNTSIAYLLGETDSTKDITSQFMLVHVVEFEACAGDGNGYAEIEWQKNDYYSVEKKAIMGHCWRATGFKIIGISGDSMEPRFFDEDKILFVEGEDVNSGDVVVVWWDNRLYIRGYLDNGDQIKLKPLNRKYPDIEINKEDERFYLLGKVIARIPPIEMVGGFF